MCKYDSVGIFVDRIQFERLDPVLQENLKLKIFLNEVHESNSLIQWLDNMCLSTLYLMVDSRTSCSNRSFPKVRELTLEVMEESLPLSLSQILSCFPKAIRLFLDIPSLLNYNDSFGERSDFASVEMLILKVRDPNVHHTDIIHFLDLFPHLKELELELDHPNPLSVSHMNEIRKNLQNLRSIHISFLDDFEK